MTSFSTGNNRPKPRKKVDPLDPAGFGMSFFLDITPNARSSSGKQKVIDAIAGRLLDGLWYEPTYGIQLLTRLRRSNPVLYPALARECEAEILKDDRLESAEVQINYDSSTNSVEVLVNAVMSELLVSEDGTGSSDVDRNISLVGNVSLITPTAIRFSTTTS